MPTAVLMGNDQALIEKLKLDLTKDDLRDLRLRLFAFMGFDYPQYLLSPVLLEKAKRVGLSAARLADWMNEIMIVGRDRKRESFSEEEFSEDEWQQVLCTLTDVQARHLYEKLDGSRRYSALKEQAYQKLTLFLTTTLAS